jgi:hypothetical protein
VERDGVGIALGVASSPVQLSPRLPADLDPNRSKQLILV